jgi:hypothetical protein
MLSRTIFFSTKLASVLSLCALPFIVHPTEALSENAPISQGFEQCKVIPEDDIRLKCLQNLLKGPAGIDQTPSTAPWPLLRTHHPNGGADAISVLRTADTTRSDPDLAGLMIRCSDRGSVEFLLALIRPISPKTRKTVILFTESGRFSMEAEAIGSGAALLLPDVATALANGPWQSEKSLGVNIGDPEAETKGYIPLDGLSVALKNLKANCAAR